MTSEATVLIENDGDEALFQDTTDSHYFFTTSSGEQIDITRDGALVVPGYDDRHYGDWEMRHIAANESGGYTVLWAAENGAWNEWQIDSNGVYLSYNVFGHSGLERFENQFQSDLNGDGEAVVLIEDDGDETLYWDAAVDLYHFTTETGARINIVRDGAQVGRAYDTDGYGDWEIRYIAANEDGGYTALWEAENGQWNEWQLDETGTFLSYQVFNASALSQYEDQFQADLDGNGEAHVLIENTGDEWLYLDAADDHYFFYTADGQQIDITRDGGLVGPAYDDRHYGDWDMRYVEANNDGGYTALWEAENGEWNVWQMDANGAYLSYNVISASVLAQLEDQFQADLDGDGEAMVLIEDNGPEALFWDAAVNQYSIRTESGDQITITRDGLPVGRAFDTDGYGDWDMRHVAANPSGGFTALWEAENGQWNEWQIDSTGAFVSYQVFEASELSNYEDQFETDLDGNGSASVLIEDDGEEWLYLDAANDHYYFTNSDGEQIDITLDGALVGPAYDDRHYGDWDMRHVAANDNGGYTALWAAENGQWNVWQMDENGARLSYNVIHASSLTQYEDQFQADLDGDGVAFVQVENNGDEALLWEAVANQYVLTTADGSQIEITRDGAPAGRSYDTDNYGDWQATHVAANDDGGYTLLWTAENGAWNEWQIDETGAFLSYEVFDPSLLSEYEDQFETDLDGNGEALVLIESNGNEALYLDAAGDHYVFTTETGNQIDITLDGNLVGPAFDTRRYGDWDMRHVAANENGGYTALWAAENGQWNEWQMDENGARLSYNVFNASSLTNYESQFQTDLDGDGLF